MDTSWVRRLLAVVGVLVVAGCGADAAVPVDAAAQASPSATEAHVGAGMASEPSISPTAAPTAAAVDASSSSSAAATAAAGGDTACSSQGAAPLPAQQLPALVAETRSQIGDALRDCDYDRLDALTADPFVYTYSTGSESPGAYWRMLEETAGAVPPLATMLAVLALEPAVDEEDGAYTWPHLAVETPGTTNVEHPSWQALVPLYGRDEVEQVEASDSGYRLMRLRIEADGAWSMAIAGD